MITNLFNKSLVKVIAYLAISPGSRYTRKEIKEKTRMHNVPLDEALAKLLFLQILKHEKSNYSLNMESEKTKQIVSMVRSDYLNFNVPYAAFISLIEVAEKLSRIKTIENIILFGSYAKLIHTEKSDIDIAVIVSSQAIENKVQNQIKKIMANISKKDKKTIEPHIFTNKEIKENSSDPLIKDILKNGKSLL